MPTPAADRIAVSTWSLHRLMGTTYPHDLSTDAVGAAAETYGPVTEPLLDIPAALHNHGFHRMELVSFHLPSRDPVYLGELRAELDEAGVLLQTLLIDAGDITDPVNGARDEAWIARWIETANELGAAHARIIAGKQPPTREAIDRSVTALRRLADGNAGSAVRLATENWFELLGNAAMVNEVLDRLEGKVGLLADFGNWRGAGKYGELAKIFGRAELCHAKASFPDGMLDTDDYGRCVDLAEAAGYAGPYTLIFDADTPEEWRGLEIERDFIVSRID
ncbi:MAG TPA: sugar phosphate isomerase/epimerase [Devosia sp.]|nr:sugar phosphate isomerase/epimerase [Devosia sp.]